MKKHFGFTPPPPPPPIGRYTRLRWVSTQAVKKSVETLFGVAAKTALDGSKIVTDQWVGDVDTASDGRLLTR